MPLKKFLTKLIYCSNSLKMLYFLLLMYKIRKFMDYKKKSLNKLNQKESYEEIDTRLASGWYVDTVENNKKKKYKTEKVSFKISKKI